MDALHTIYMSRLLFTLYIGLKPDTHILINLIILYNMHFNNEKYTGMDRLNTAQYHHMNHYIYTCTSLSNHTESWGHAF